MLQGGTAAIAAGPAYRFVFYLHQQPPAAEDLQDEVADASRPLQRIAVNLPPPVRECSGFVSE